MRGGDCSSGGGGGGGGAAGRRGCSLAANMATGVPPESRPRSAASRVQYMHRSLKGLLGRPSYTIYFTGMGRSGKWEKKILLDADGTGYVRCRRKYCIV